MNLKEIIDLLKLKKFAVSDENEKRQVENLYCGDLLSDVMANVPPESMWLTIQGHLNIVGVAQLSDVACIVLVNGMEPDPQTLEKAEMMDVAICGSQKSSAELCMELAGKI